MIRWVVGEIGYGFIYVLIRFFWWLLLFWAIFVMARLGYAMWQITIGNFFL